MNEPIQVLASGLGFTEGPVLLAGGGTLVVSVDQGLVVWIDDDGSTQRQPVGPSPNGAAENASGGILIAQCGSDSPIANGPPGPGGVQVVDRAAGDVRWLTQAPRSPNDLCLGPDGLVYCTDPTRPLAAADGRVWSCDPVSGEAHLLATMNWYPNGIGFGPEDDWLYVADTTGRRIVRFPLNDGRCGTPEVAVELVAGHPDGFAFDADGNIVVAAVQFDPNLTGAIHTYSPAGSLLDVISPGAGRLYTNVAIGAGGEMVITDSDEGRVLRCRHPLPGLPLHPFRSKPDVT